MRVLTTSNIETDGTEEISADLAIKTFYRRPNKSWMCKNTFQSIVVSVDRSVCLPILLKKLEPNVVHVNSLRCAKKTFPKNKYRGGHESNLGAKVMQCKDALERGSDCAQYTDNHNIKGTTKREPCADCLNSGRWIHNGQQYVLRA